LLDDLGVTKNTIVVFMADNGGMKFSWPDGQTSPFHSEKATTWEGGVRVPALVRWPGVVKPGTVFNGIFAHNDWMPTFLAAAGDPDVKKKLLKGMKAGDMTYKVHLDGYDQTAMLSGKGPSARKEFHYVTDDGDYAALRLGKWKLSFLTQECVGNDVWSCVPKTQRYPRIADLRADPFENAQQNMASFAWQQWAFRRIYLLVPAQGVVGKFVKSFKEYPARGAPASFSVGDALKMISKAQNH
jgi:arylsulfatase A-like enzyme